MTREELLNGYKEDVRDFAKECVHFEGELDATFFDNWAEHFTNLAERLHSSLPGGLEEAAEKHSRANMYDGWDYERIYNAFIAGAEWGMNQMPLPEDTTIFQKGVAEGKRLMMEGAVEGRVYNSYNVVHESGGPSFHGIELVYPDMDKPYIIAGDTVKVIFIPEEK